MVDGVDEPEEEPDEPEEGVDDFSADAAGADVFSDVFSEVDPEDSFVEPESEDSVAVVADVSLAEDESLAAGRLSFL